MTADRQSPPPSKPKRPESWRMERIIQRVPAHLGESTRESVSPWIVLAGVILLFLIACAVIFILIGGSARLGGLGLGGGTPTPTRAPRSATPAVTIIPVTLPPTGPTPGPTPTPFKYKVKPGDSLLEIAARYKVSVQAIKAANGLKDDTIRVGEELIIPLPTPTPPPGSQPKPPPATTPTPLSLQSPPTSASPAGTPGVISHTVKRGDTLISIAATYGSSVQAIRIANQLDNNAILSIGQVLLVPVGAWTPPATATPLVVAAATPTAQFAYPAPNLLWPPDHQALYGSKDVPTLSWVSPATLKPNEVYVVYVETGSGAEKKSWTFTVKQGTSKALEASLYPGPNANGTRFSWYVVVMSQVPGASGRTDTQTPPMTAQSPPSAMWTFVWY